MAAPPGNNNAGKGKIFFDALHRALKTYENKKRKIKRGEALDRIANSLIEEALDRSAWATQELINRLDGRAHQSIDITGEVTHASQLTDAQLIERIEWLNRASDAARAVGSTPSPQDAPAVHPVHERPLDS